MDRFDTGCHIRLESFSGPLSEFVARVRRGEVSIRAVRLCDVTGQYTAALKALLAADLARAGEALRLCALLVCLKVRALLPAPLPAPPAEEDAAAEDERLAALAEAYAGVREAAGRLRALIEARSGRAWREGGAAHGRPEFTRPVGDARAADLAAAWRRVLARQRRPPLPERPFSVEAQLPILSQRLRAAQRIAFDALFPEEADRSERVCTFLALLELIRLGRVRAERLGVGQPMLLVWVGREAAAR
ncbi:MAG TPA: hypothetical protein VF234_04085 [Limnochordia bacterium]